MQTVLPYIKDTAFPTDNYRLPDGWKSARLGDLGTIRSGTTPLRARHQRYFVGGSIPWVKTTDLTNAAIIKTEESITPLAVQEARCPILEPNTVLVAMYGGFNQIGRTGLTTSLCTLNQALSAIQVNHLIAYPKYVLYWLNSNVLLWRNFAASSRKDPNITRNDVCSFPILLPSLPEQTRIVQILESADAVVRAVESLIEAKSCCKRALAEQLMTGRVRFPEFKGQAWREAKLSEFLSEKSERCPANETPVVLSCSKLYGILLQSDRFSKQMASHDLRRYKFVEPGNLVFDPMLLWDASIAFSELRGVVSPAYCTLLFVSEHADWRFFRYLLYTATMRYNYKAISKGTNARRKKVLASDFLKVKVQVPSLTEQHKIADVLSLMDEEIGLLRRELKALKRQKQGLMQKLLTGQVRVKEFRP